MLHNGQNSCQYRNDIAFLVTHATYNVIINVLLTLFRNILMDYNNYKPLNKYNFSGGTWCT